MISRQIGWSQESNLLYEIGKQMDILAKVLANSGKGSLEIYPNLSSFPPTGVPSVIYLAEDTGYIYYWDGASYIQFGGGSYVPTSRQLTINGVTFDLSADRTWTINTGDDIIVVANYSALPAPNTVSGQFYWCSNAQGTAWLPGSVGGTYYNSGLYYSNGTTWEFLNVPYQATQSEVNAGIISDKFVTPNTLFNSTQWATKQGALTLTTTGTSGAATLVGNTLNIPQYSGGGGMAIGGSITSATAGSVLFAGTSGVLAQDNSNLFWDNTNKRLGIGTNAPISRLETFNNSIYVAGAFSMYSNTASDESVFYFRRGRGTLASPIAVSSGDVLGSVRFAAQFDTVVGNYNTNAKIEGVAESNGANLRFYTNSSGLGASTSEKLRITGSGNVIIQNGGTFTDAGYRLDVNGTSRLQGKLTVSTGGSEITGTTRFAYSSTKYTDFIPVIDGAVNVQVNGVTKFFIGASPVSGIEIPSAYSIAFVNPGVTTFSNINWSTTSNAFEFKNGDKTAFAPVITGPLSVTGSTTASGAIARGANYTPTLVAAANNDVLVGLDVNPTFTNGAFTGVVNIPLRIGTSSTTPFGGPLIFMGRDQNAESNFQISNSTSGTSATVGFRIFGANGRSSQVFEFSALHSTTEFASHLVIEPNSPGAIKHGLILSLPESTSGSDLMVYTNGRNATNRRLTLFNSSGNLLLQSGGTHTDAGFRLDVNGTARFQSDVTINGSAGTHTTYGLKVTNNNTNVNSLLLSNNNLAAFYTTPPTYSSVSDCNIWFGASGILSASQGGAQFFVGNNAYWTGSQVLRKVSGYVSSLGFTVTGNIVFATGGTGAANSVVSDSTDKLLIFNNGNVLIQSGGTFTDAGFRLDVNGTCRVQDNLTISKNQNAITQINISNTTSGTSSQTSLVFTSDAASGSASIGKYSTTTSAFKIIQPKDTYFYNVTAGDISIMNDVITGNIKFAAGASSSAQLTLASNGNLLLGTTTDAGFRLDVAGTCRVQSALNIGDSVYNDGGFSKFILGTSSTTGASRISIPSAQNYQDIQFIKTNATANTQNFWSFGQRFDTYFGNTSGSFQIIGGYIDNAGGNGAGTYQYRVPIIANPNGDVLINGASANALTRYIGLGVNAPTALTDIGASTTTRASLRIRSGTAPTTPNDGDIWFDGTDLKMRIGGVTKTFTLI